MTMTLTVYKESKKHCELSELKRKLVDVRKKIKKAIKLFATIVVPAVVDRVIFIFCRRPFL